MRRLRLHYAVGIQLNTQVQLLRNPDEIVSVTALLACVKARPFRRYAWREGTKKTLDALFAFFPVRIPKSERAEPLWLIIERRDGAADRDRAHLRSLPAHTPKKRLIYMLKERWYTEAVYQESKQQLGLDHYQGRLYPGLQHHLSAVICTYAFIVAERERNCPDGNPRAAPMKRTARIPQRHAPYSIATLRKELAIAITPWFAAWRPDPPPRQAAPQTLPSTAQLADEMGG